jgi:ribosomal protein L25 (general stress protein Ctc)
MEFIVNAEKEIEKVHHTSRNIRREGSVPGIIYGAGDAEELFL